MKRLTFSNQNGLYLVHKQIVIKSLFLFILRYIYVSLLCSLETILRNFSAKLNQRFNQTDISSLYWLLFTHYTPLSEFIILNKSWWELWNHLAHYLYHHSYSTNLNYLFNNNLILLIYKLTYLLIKKLDHIYLIMDSEIPPMPETFWDKGIKKMKANPFVPGGKFIKWSSAYFDIYVLCLKN